MNAAERRTAILAACLLLLGWGARALPPSLCANCGDLSAKQVVKIQEPFQEIASGSTETPIVSRSVSTRGSAKTVSGPIAVNRATVAELQNVKGIGPVLAKRIVEFRDRNGKFKGPKDLDKVSGIGQKKLDNLLPLLIFD